MNTSNKSTQIYITSIFVTIFLLTSLTTRAEIAQWLEKIGSASVTEGYGICEELCKQGEPKIVELCQHIKPQGDDRNARLFVRMLVNYASTQSTEIQNTVVRGFVKALQANQDTQIKAFLISELQMLGNPLSVEAIAEYIGNKDLCDYAIRALQTINNDVCFQKLCENLSRSEGRCQQGIITALAEIGNPQAIMVLEKLFNSAPPETKEIILIAIAQLENDSEKYYKLIETQLSADKPLTRKQSYTLLFTQIERVAKQKGITPQQKNILETLLQQAYKENDNGAICAILHLFTYLPPKDIIDLFAREVYNPQPEISAVALQYFAKMNTKESKNVLKEALVKSASGGNAYQVLDAVEKVPDSLFIPAIVPLLTHSDEKVRMKAIQCLIKMDADKAIPILVKRLKETTDKTNLNAIQQALLQTPPKETVTELGSSLKKLKGERLVVALDILAQRQAEKYFKFALQQTKDKDAKVQKTALNAIALMGTPKDVPSLIKQLTDPKNPNQDAIGEAIVHILKHKEDEDRCKPIFSAMDKAKPEQYALLLSILAKVDDASARDFVLSWLNLPSDVPQNKVKIENAISALTLWDNPKLAENMIAFLRKNPNHPYRNDVWKTLIRFLSLPGLTPDEKVWVCEQAIGIMPENAGDMFTILGGISNSDSFLTVAKYTTNPQFADIANKTLVRIAMPDKNNENGITGRDIVPYLENALKYIDDATLKENIQKHIEKCKNAPYTLPVVYEDDNQFTLLFNGSNLKGWSGYTRGFVPEFGKLVCLPTCHLNLFTEKPYKDFILRFEFKLYPGANNGIGLRVPYMKHSAYNGMEIQILDDNAPENSGLKPYQYHGSIYGVLPTAVPAPLKKCGEWNQQEIILQGSKISVRVNGVEILTADLKELANKPTPDEKAHPGLLNEEGHIALLGHGSRVEFRNIRIKQL
ncbi:MAG: DUF1080 domain-containing protein [Candidatus Hydrogenedens sp.]